MASRELYSSIGKPKPKKLNFGQQIGEYGKVMADTALSGIGGLVGTDMSNIIDDGAYKADWAKKVSSITSPLANVAGNIAPMLMGAPAGPAIFAKGGLRTFEGNSHEEGGIPLGQDEVEGNETMVPMDSQSDFIFSDRLYPIKSISPKGKITFSKKSFAQLSKQINKPLELRPNDPYSKKTVDMKLGKLAQEQEALKQSNDTEQFAMGGKRYDGGGGRSSVIPITKQRMTGNNLFGNVGEADINSLMENNPWYDWKGFNSSNKEDVKKFQQTFNRNAGEELLEPDGLFGPQTASAIYRNELSSMQLTPKGAGILPTSTAKSLPIQPYKRPTIPNNHNNGDSFQSNFLPTALGYAAQAATNLPAFFMKPDTVNLPRVKFDDISLAEQRNEARRSRNLGLASARGIGGNDTGQMMNYLSGTTAGMNSVYGNQFNQSLMEEKQINAETNMREQLANSQIGMQEEQINTAEKDAIRNLKMQALSNIGTSAAMAGKDYMMSQGADAQINALMASNPDYTYKIVNGKLIPVRIKAMGGKRGKV